MVGIEWPRVDMMGTTIVVVIVVHMVRLKWRLLMLLMLLLLDVPMVFPTNYNVRNQSIVQNHAWFRFDLNLKLKKYFSSLEFTWLYLTDTLFFKTAKICWIIYSDFHWSS